MMRKIVIPSLLPGALDGIQIIVDENMPGGSMIVTCGDTDVLVDFNTGLITVWRAKIKTYEEANPGGDRG